MITAIAIDDEPPSLQIIETFCSNINFIDLQKTFTKPADAKRYLKNFPVNLIFLDINMPSISGIDLYKNLEQETMVIFTTAYSEFAVEGFNLCATDYLLKPFTFDRFLQAVNKANDFFNYKKITDNNEKNYIYIRADYSLNKINIADIQIIEGFDDYIKIHLTNCKTVVCRMTMKSILESLPTTKFVRVHRSFIIPIEKIDSIKNKIININDFKIPIGVSYENDFFSLINIK